MGSVGTWILPVTFSLFCAFVAACCWRRSDDPGTGAWLIAKKENELLVAIATIWSLLGWLVWLTLVHLRGGSC